MIVPGICLTTFSAGFQAVLKGTRFPDIVTL